VISAYTVFLRFYTAPLISYVYVKVNFSLSTLEVLKGKIPEASEECKYCRWNAENQKF
jgi:hypothetical protein